MEYKNPKPTVDVIIDHHDKILLIERKNPPFGWALPGGFVDEGEAVEAAAIREAKEETNLDVRLKQLLYVYSDPKRDLRQHNISIVFIAEASDIETTMKAGDDATKADFFSFQNLPPLAFDHKEIITDYLRWKNEGLLPNPSQKLPA